MFLSALSGLFQVFFLRNDLRTFAQITGHLSTTLVALFLVFGQCTINNNGDAAGQIFADTLRLWVGIIGNFVHQ